MFPRLDYKFSSIEERVEALLDTIQQLQHHKLSINLLSQKQLLALGNDVMSSAESLAAVPLPQNHQDYFQLQTSYLKSGDEIQILLRVPCSATENQTTIYKYIPFPFPVLPTSTILPVFLIFVLFNILLMYNNMSLSQMN
jgi:hypothetical protein